MQAAEEMAGVVLTLEPDLKKAALIPEEELSGLQSALQQEPNSLKIRAVVYNSMVAELLSRDKTAALLRDISGFQKFAASTLKITKNTDVVSNATDCLEALAKAGSPALGMHDMLSGYVSVCLLLARSSRRSRIRKRARRRQTCHPPLSRHQGDV